MNETVKTIDSRLDELDKEFNEIKEKVIEAEAFIIKGKEAMVSLRGAYAELTNLKSALEQENEVEDKAIDVKGESNGK